MGSHYAFINGKLTPVIILHRYQPDDGRRRYNSQSGTHDYSTGYATYSSQYTYTLPSNGYTGPALNSYGSGLATYDIMSRYSRGLDYSRTYDAPATSHDMGTRSGDDGTPSRYGGSQSLSGYDSVGGGMYSTNSYRYDPNAPNYVASAYATGVPGYDVTARSGFASDQAYSSPRYTSGNPLMSRTHDDRKETQVTHHGPRGETHRNRREEEDKSREKHERHRVRPGVEKDDEMSMYKASYRRYREVHEEPPGRTAETEVLPDSSLTHHRDNKDIIAEIKNKYRPHKRDDETQQASKDSQSKTSTRSNDRKSSSRTESSTSSTSTHGRFDRLPSTEKSEPSHDKDADAMPTWRKRRLEREQRRKEFLSMSESRSKERERKKSEEKEKSEQDSQSLNKLGNYQSESRSDKTESRPHSQSSRQISKDNESRLHPSSLHSESRIQYSGIKTDDHRVTSDRNHKQSESRTYSRESRSSQTESRSHQSESGPHSALSRLKQSDSTGRQDQQVQTQTDFQGYRTESQGQTGHEGSVKSRSISAEAMKNILMQRDSPLLRTRYAEAKRKKEQEREGSREEGESSQELKSREFYSLPTTTAKAEKETKPVKRAESLSSVSKSDKDKLIKPVKRTESLYTSPLKAGLETIKDGSTKSETTSDNRPNVLENKQRSWSSSERILAGNLADKNLIDSNTKEKKDSDSGRYQDRQSPMSRYLQSKKNSSEQTVTLSDKSVPMETHKPVFSKSFESPSAISKSSEHLKPKVSISEDNKHDSHLDQRKAAAHLETSRYLDSLKTKHLDSKTSSNEVYSDVDKSPDYFQSAKSRYFDSIRQTEIETKSKDTNMMYDGVHAENKDKIERPHSTSSMTKKSEIKTESLKLRPLGTLGSKENVRSEKPEVTKSKLLESVKQGSLEDDRQVKMKIDTEAQKVQTPEYKVLRQPQQYSISKTESQIKEDLSANKAVSDKEAAGLEVQSGQGRRMRQYGKTKAVTTDVASLLTKAEEKDEERSKSKEDSDTASNTGLTRFERIAQYKEERRRQLAYIANRFGDLDSSDKTKSVDVVPSLFHASSRGNSIEREDMSPLARSKSMKESPQPKAVSLVSRSKSLREEADLPRSSESQGPEADSSSANGKISLAAKFAHFRNRFEEGNVSQIELEDSFSAKVQKDETNKELSSLEKARQTCLHAESEGNKSEKSDIKQEKKDADNTSQEVKPLKRRRQLPSIPVVMGEKSDQNTEPSALSFESLQRRFSSSDQPPSSPGVKIATDVKRRSSSTEPVQSSAPIPVVRNIAAEIANRWHSSSSEPQVAATPTVLPTAKATVKTLLQEKPTEQPSAKLSSENLKITSSQTPESKKTRYQRATVKNVRDILGTMTQDVQTSQSNEVLQADKPKNTLQTPTVNQQVDKPKDTLQTPTVNQQVDKPKDTLQTQTASQPKTQASYEKTTAGLGIVPTKESSVNNKESPEIMRVPKVKPSVLEIKTEKMEDSNKVEIKEEVNKAGRETFKTEYKPPVKVDKESTKSFLIPSKTGVPTIVDSVPVSKQDTYVIKQETKDVAPLKSQVEKDSTKSADYMTLKMGTVVSPPQIKVESKKTEKETSKSTPQSEPKTSVSKMVRVGDSKKQGSSVTDLPTTKDENIGKPVTKVEGEKDVVSVSKIRAKKEDGTKLSTKDSNVQSSAKIRKSEEKKDGTKKEQKVLVKRRVSDKRQRTRETAKPVDGKEIEKKVSVTTDKKPQSTTVSKSSVVKTEKTMKVDVSVKKTEANSKSVDSTTETKVSETLPQSEEREKPKENVVAVTTELTSEILEKSSFKPIEAAPAKKDETVVVKEKPKSRRHFKKLDKAGIKRSKSVSDKDRRSPRRQLPLGDTIFSKADMMRILTKSPEANLDDLLQQNADYLTDPELVSAAAGELPDDGSSKARKGHKDNPKLKRSLKKKLVSRSKSDTTQLMEIAKSRRESNERSETNQEKEGQTTLHVPTEAQSEKIEGRERSGTYTIGVESVQDDKDQSSAQEEIKFESEKVSITQTEEADSESINLKSELGNIGFDSKDLPVSQNFGVDLTKHLVHEAQKTTPAKVIVEETVDPRIHFSVIDESKMESEKDSLRVTTTDSDSVADSSGGTRGERSERRRRKDKSSARKSPLNFSPTPDVTRNGIEHTSDREGIRNGNRSPSHHTHEETADHGQAKPPSVTSIHPLQKSLKHDQFTASNILNHDDSSQHAPGRSGSVLDKLLPSKFSLPSKVSSAISKFSGDNEKSQESPVQKVEDKSPRRIARRQDFSSLLQKFSSSDQSSSETEQQSPRRRFSLKRQEAYSVSSDESSSERSRRTPERTQSLRMHKSPTPEDRTELKLVQRSGSFKSDFMRRRYSPEPTNRVPLPEDHGKKNIREEQTDKPTPELASVLHRRQDIVAEQQRVGEQAERDRITDKSVEKENIHPSAAEVSQVITDQQVVNILQSRRKETDISDKDEENLVISRSEPASVGGSLLTVSSTPGPTDVSHFHKSCTSLSHTESVSTSTAQSLPKSAEVFASVSSKRSEPSAVYTVKDSNLDMTAIDASLAVLNQVTADIDDTTTSRNVDITVSLSKLHVDSPAEVQEFIKNVQKSNHIQEPPKIGKHKEGSPVQEVKARVVAKISPDRDNIAKESSPIRVRSTLSPFVDRSGSPGTNPLSPAPPSLALKRTRSYGRAEGSDHKPKGILKRTPSLKHAGVIVDPELADILQKRRQQQGDEEEEAEESGPLSAVEEIKQTRRKELAAKKALDDGDLEETSQKSMAERIYQMQTKLEDTSKSCPITPKNRSGTTTPKFTFKGRPECLTPKAQLSFDESLLQPQVSGEQLIQKLSSLANKGKSVSQKRKQFQQTSRHDFRRHTQPVTLDELQEADSLDSVRAFRAEVLRKASTNIFESSNKKDKTKTLTHAEYPQPFHRVKLKRHRKDRHKTLPVTAAELGAIPEGQTFESPLCAKKDFLGTRDSKTDSGILSGSDVESYFDSQMSDSLRSLSLEMDINDDDPARLSVSAKASMFTKQIEEKSKADKVKVSASGAKRYIDRKKRERSRTQPVTEDEVKTAAEIADGTEEGDNSEKKDDKSEIKPADVQKEEKTDSDDELSRRSLAEKVKLFSTLKEEVKKPAASTPVVRKRNRKLTSRFQTQPVTIEEVEKAAEFRISPLAKSLVKPPDPELLKGLPVSAQWELMAQHAEACLSQPSSRSSSRHGSMKDLSTSRHGSSVDVSVSKTGSALDLAESDSKGILKHGESGKESNVKSILKPDHLQSPEREIKGILKAESGHHDIVEPKSILKSEELSDTEPSKGILKHTETDRVASPESDQKGILKHQAVESKETSIDSDYKGILKLSDSLEDLKGKTQDIKGMFKKESSVERIKSSEPRGILKKESSFEAKKSEPEKSVLKKSPSKDSALIGELKGILKKDSSEEEVEVKDEESPVMESVDDKSITKEEAKEERADEENLSAESTVIKRRGRDKNQTDRYLTQPAEVTTPEKSPDTPRKFKYTGRHKTQPITPEEKRAAEASQDVGDEVDMGSTSSIKDRLNALKKSGEEDWKKRIAKQFEDEDLASSPDVKMRPKLSTTPVRPSSIADRLTKLGSAQEGWRGRVEENDAKRFTVAHKIAGQVEESPLVSKLKRRAKKESDSESGSEVTSPSTPTKEWPKIPIPTALVSGPPTVKPDMEIRGVIEPEEEKGPVTVRVPDLDDDILEAFFTKTNQRMELEPVDVKIDDFDELFIEANEILETAKRIRPKRKYTARSKNPLKTMSLNLEVKAEYEEIKFGYAEQELKRQKTAAISKDAGFAQEALAGLASKENFAKVSLRKTADTPSKSSSRLDPYKDVMLLHVKGRRRVQTRLVEPCAKSINSGDCYLLVASDKVITWNGEYCNVIEKAKAADIASMILQKKDMGCKSASGVGIVEERRQHLGTGKAFWNAIGGLQTVACGGPTEEDELYENHIVETNMVYRLVHNTLTPYQEFWGTTPKYSMLKKDEVLVFDFGTEFYIWQGKAVKPEQRKLGLKLARQLWDKGYDYSSCDINPFCPLITEEMGGLPMKAATRPDWALFGKVNQNMETILFREKFSDWPDNSRLIQVKGQTEVSGSKSDLSDLKAYDAKLLIPVNMAPVSLVLEGSNLGRGVNWSEDMEGFIREQNIVTLGVMVWHVLEYDHYKVPEKSYGQFHDGDTYVVRWQYMITNKGTKDLKGSQSRRSLVGRERCAYFFWQGKGSTINEKGASALMTVELDEERGPQVRVDEGKEMPCFLNLFDGSMIIHIGKREEEATNTQGSWRCYCIRHDYPNETCLMEVPAGTHCLRSRSSLLFLNVNSGQLFVWHGCKSPEHVQSLAKAAAERLKLECPLEVGLHAKASIEITEMKEGSEGAEFWRMMGTQADGISSHYHTLLKDTLPYNHTIRLFHMTSVSGVFVVQEVMNPSRVSDLATPFPVLQSDLYKASQPALFLVDNDHCVYLWHGWWPEGDEEIENVQTGSAQARYNTDRKCAIDTVLQYCSEKNKDNPPKAYAVYGGLEPLQFTNLFPYWEEDETAKEINLRDGKKDKEMTPVETILEKVTQARYTFAQLQERPLPEGVDPLKLESYLEEEEFEEILEMSKDDFYLLPQWQQNKLKQQVDLF